MNSEMRFDPQTGKPIAGAPNSSNLASATLNSQQQPVQPQSISVPPIDTPTDQSIMQNNTEVNNNNMANIQQQMQSIPTVEQNRQEFMNNANANNKVKEESKESKPNITFIIILFVIILAAIFFLFPYLLNIIG